MSDFKNASRCSKAKVKMERAVVAIGLMQVLAAAPLGCTAAGALERRRGLPHCRASRTLHRAPPLGYTAENEPARGFDVFRWGKRKKGYGFLSYHCHIPVRHCLT